jgi:ribosomal protein S18 acetylase RimI-like enzyme
MDYLKAQNDLLGEHPRIGKWMSLHKNEFGDQNRPVWLAKDGDDIVGIIIGRLDRPVKGKSRKTKDVKMSVLHVSDKVNRYRIMSDLLETFEKGVSGIGKTKVHLLVYADDRESMGFFVQHGYVTVKELLHKTEFPLRVRILMVKEPLAK